MTRENYLERAGKATPSFWSTAFEGTPTVAVKDALAIVEVHSCGCQRISGKANELTPGGCDERDYDVCRRHRRTGMMPSPKKALAIEYYA